jgi:hypothetical protein
VHQTNDKFFQRRRWTLRTQKVPSVFTFLEISAFVQLLKLKGDAEAMIDVTYLLLKGSKLYQLL